MIEREQLALAALVCQSCGVDVAQCYQCGKCTAGCPMAKYMDLSPNQVMRLVQAGDQAAADKVLASTAIWSCAGCLTCTQRCPKQLDPAAVMDALRQIAYEKNVVSPRQKKVLAFHKAFLKTVEQTGRMHELSLVGRYKLSTLDLFGDLAIAPAMLARDKLPLTSHKIPGIRQVRKIFATCRKRGMR